MPPDGVLLSYQVSHGYADSPDFGSDPNPDLDPVTDERYQVNSTLLMMKENGTERGFCEACWNAKKNGVVTTPFHHRVNDPVITRFTTRLGPISRPTKSLPLSEFIAILYFLVIWVGVIGIL